MQDILGYPGLQSEQVVSWQKDVALEAPLNHQPQAIQRADRLTGYFIAVSALCAVTHTRGVALSATHPTPHLQA